MARKINKHCWSGAFAGVRIRKSASWLDAAETLGDFRVPPGNRLEKLAGDRVGQYSIRVNRQWRICFRWSDAGPDDVEIVDYHQEERGGG